LEDKALTRVGIPFFEMLNVVLPIIPSKYLPRITNLKMKK
jgi:hypothetical protein